MRSIVIDTVDNILRGAAAGIDNTLKIFDLPNHKLEISSQYTDAGEGGTRIDLFRKLEEVDGIKNRDEYMYPTCGLYGLNLTLSAPTTLTIGYSELFALHRH